MNFVVIRIVIHFCRIGKSVVSSSTLITVAHKQLVLQNICTMNKISVFLLIGLSMGVNSLFDNEITLKCHGKTFKNVTLTAYYPDYTDQDHEQGYQDKHGEKLRTLQDYIDNRSEFVTLAMDSMLGIPYGTKVCIPELNEHFGHRILLEVDDSSFDLKGSGYMRADICVRTEIDSYDETVNRVVTLVFV